MSRTRSPKPVPGCSVVCGRYRCGRTALAGGVTWPGMVTGYCGICLSPSDLRTIRRMTDDELLKLPAARLLLGMGNKIVVDIGNLRGRGLVA